MSVSRRDLLRSSSTLAAASFIGSLVGSAACAAAQAAPSTPAATHSTTRPMPATTQASDRPRIGVIGCGSIARHHGRTLPKYGDVVALCDVDSSRLESYNKDIAGGKASTFGDYRKLLDRSDVDMVWVTTPDHWHTRCAIDAMRAGKDVYCEKPLTLTIAEGRLLCKVVRETNRVLQVGTQQRSDPGFMTAIALAHAGRMGKIRQVTVVVGDTPKSAEFKIEAPPPELNWDMWLGQTPMVPYIKQRCHYEFRWWFEYSGGKMTDWGAHHVDIAQLAVAPDLPGPMFIEPLMVELPVRFERGYPLASNAYNTASRFNVKCTFANGVEMFIRDAADGFPAENGILIEGDGGWCFVNRGKLFGTAVDGLKENPLPEGAVKPILKHDPKTDHPHQMNFIECCKTRATPISDVWSHHKHLTTCHLSNIAMRLGRKIRWDASAQEIVGDAEADAFQSRAQRKGYEVI
jgi:predicted dehydrogenase